MKTRFLTVLVIVVLCCCPELIGFFFSMWEAPLRNGGYHHDVWGSRVKLQVNRNSMFTLRTALIKKRRVKQPVGFTLRPPACVCVCVSYCVCLLCLQRPLALQCLRQMQDPSFPCLSYMLPCDSHSQLFLSQLQGHSAVFWSGDKDERCERSPDLQESSFSCVLVFCGLSG